MRAHLRNHATWYLLIPLAATMLTLLYMNLPAIGVGFGGVGMLALVIFDAIRHGDEKV